MTALGFAAVPLYRIFCQVTGFAGTTQVASSEDAAAAAEAGRAAGGTISVRFDANAAPDIPWDFKAEIPTVDVKLGQRKMAFFMAHNRSDVPVTGAASFNVSPGAILRGPLDRRRSQRRPGRAVHPQLHLPQAPRRGVIAKH